MRHKLTIAAVALAVVSAIAAAVGGHWTAAGVVMAVAAVIWLTE